MRATVLIVDDHRTFRANARALLEADGFEVVGEAPDGDAAVVAERELRPDVVLLDVRLPDTDGFSIAQLMAAQPELCRYRWDPETLTLHDPVVTPVEVSAAIARYNSLFPDRRALSTRDPANFLRTLFEIERAPRRIGPLRS